MTSKKLLRAADIVAQRLYQAGCRYAFGMPGGEVLTMVDALEKAGIKFILCKHENNAGFVAEGLHHRNGAPGILVATIGPGAMNCINVVVNALQDRVPLIVITGCVDETEALSYTHQVMDHQAVYRPITKASFRLTSEGAGIITDKAINLVTEGQSGPVHIDVPISVATEEVEDMPLRVRKLTSKTTILGGEDFAQALRWFEKSRRPVMLIGLDAVKDNAGETIRGFVEKFSIPFITTYKAKGIVSEDHPLCLGGAGLSPLNDKILLPFIKSADLIICLGYDPIEMRAGWREIWDPEETPVIEFSSTPNYHYMHRATRSFVADTQAALKSLQNHSTPKTTWENGEPAKIRKALEETFAAEETWGASAAIHECRRVLPKDTIATVDSGAHRILLSQVWKSYQPRTILQSTAFCTMGCAVPLAIGAKIAEPNRPVVSFSGDAGMLMVVGELSTVKELGINPIFVVFTDASLALIELKQRRMTYDNAGVDFTIHDFEAIGKSFGGNGFTVRSKGELADALNASLKSEKFSVISVLIDKKSYDGKF